MIPYSRHSISRRDSQGVLKVLQSDWITQGPAVAEFEQKLAKVCGAKYAIAVTNGTAALHLACLALGVGSGDEVITSPNTFLATSNSVLYCGGYPVFADIDSETLNLNPEAMKSKISRRTKGVIPVHFAGYPCDMDRISKIARSRGLFVLEDASHALGARYRLGARWFCVGSCAHSDACVFSFHPVKGITTGEGGAITTNRKDLYEALLTLRTHGVVKRPDLFENKKLAFRTINGAKQAASWYYEMQTLGFNYRITDFQCMLGVSQLSRLPQFIKRRRQIAKFYDQIFGRLDLLETPREKENVESAYHLYVIRLRLEKLSVGRAEIFEELRERGLGVQVHYIPVHLQPFYRKMGYRSGDFPEAEAYYERAISIPIYPALKMAQVREVARKVIKVLKSHAI